MRRHEKHLDFPSRWLRTRGSGVRISPGAPLFLKENKRTPRFASFAVATFRCTLVAHPEEMARVFERGSAKKIASASLRAHAIDSVEAETPTPMAYCFSATYCILVP